MTNKNKIYGVILAGGVGSRFWPMSREAAPKQLLRFIGSESLLESTIKRIKPIIKAKDISIVTNTVQAELMTTHLKAKSYDAIHYIKEPFGRNTTAAIGLAAVELLVKDADAVMAVLPADHLIEDNTSFNKCLEAAATVARDGSLVTFGIKPKTPETGYGYIKSKKTVLKKAGGKSFYKVDKFVEKPDLKKAKSYLKSGNYLWNSGIFVWRADAILKEIRKLEPSIYKSLVQISKGGSLERAYKNIKSISIDNGILERSKKVVVLKAPFDWSDVGSWSALPDVLKSDKKGNIVKGDVIEMGNENSLIIGSDSRLTAVTGVKDLIVVDTQDATLVCHKDSAQDVKKIVDELKKSKRTEHITHVTVERPWGSYTVIEEGKYYKVKRIMVRPGKRLSLQSHKKRSEHWVVISGVATVTCDKKTSTIKKHESTFIPVGAKHRLANTGTKPLEIIEVQNGTYLGEDDIIRYDDDFNRA